MDKENMVHIFNGILLSHKKEWNNATCNNKDGPRDYHTKWSKSEGKDKNSVSLICGIYKYDTNEHTYETETDSQIENRLVVANLWLGMQAVGGERISSWGLADAN